MIYQYQIRLLIVIGESEWFLMVQKIISSLTTIILSILFPLARWATIEMLSNSPPTSPIAPGEWATTKGTPWDLMVDGETYECVKSFCYLGDTLDGDGGADLAATARIRNGWMKFRELWPFLTSRAPPLEMKG